MNKKTVPVLFRLSAFFIMLIMCSDHVHAQTIPASQRVNWQSVGLYYSFSEPSKVINVSQFGAVGDGITDNYPFIANAIQSVSGPSVILFPTGTYLIKGTLNVPDSVIIKGSSSDSTFLHFDLSGSGGNCIQISKSQSSVFSGIVSGYTKGSDTLLLPSVIGLSAGDFVQIRQQNGFWNTSPATWAENCVGQIVRITGMSGNRITFFPPLRIDYDSLLTPQFRKINPVFNSGVECLSISRKDNPVSGAGYNIYFEHAVQCRIRGIESNVSAGSHILANASAHLEISGSYIHHAFTYDGASTRGYGVTLIQQTGDCRIENNIFRTLRHAMMVKQGANGNVFAYNYSYDPLRTEIPTNGGGDISLHGHYPFANLFEGNIVQNIHIDQAWGPSGPYNTFFRNRAELFGIIMTSGSVNSDRQNFAGNEVTNSSFPYGNYALAGSGHFAHGNNIKGTITPSGTNSLPDTSYYLVSSPSFWNITPALPSIGIPNMLSSGSIPAKVRNATGNNFTTCSTIPPTFGAGFQVFQPDAIQLMVSGGKTNVLISGTQVEELVSINFVNMNGISQSKLNPLSTGSPRSVKFELPEYYTHGMYLVRLNYRNMVRHHKVILPK